jgi:prepilin-type processing-associated H-X9-DG protein
MSALSGGTGYPGLCGETGLDASRPRFWSAAPTGSVAAERRGFRWADGNPVFTVMNTMLPLNKPVCHTGAETTTESKPFQSGIFSPSSRHQGGCHVLMGDGAVKFITDSIEAGSPTTLVRRQLEFRISDN